MKRRSPRSAKPSGSPTKADLLARIAALARELGEAREQQTATSEVLKVISRSTFDLQPVFDTILEHAAKLCEGQLALLWLHERGEQFRLAAGHGARPDFLARITGRPWRFGRPFFRESGPWRIGQFDDVRDTEPYRRGDELWVMTADQEGMRTLLGVPLVKDGHLVGSIAIYRREVRRFTGAHVELVKTFADQAVIAIENVRLFTELQARNRDLTETLEQQTATSEILRVISSSPTNIQPVLDAVAQNASRLCDVPDVVILLADGDVLRLAARVGSRTSVLPSDYAYPLLRGSVVGRAVLDRTIVHVHDLATVSEEEYPLGREIQRQHGQRTNLAVPLLREGVALGAISVMRYEVRPLSDKQIALLRTFADQAVIAIENVRLFKELEAKNRDLTTALDQQTATSDILRVISTSPTETRPVFETIVQNARRLLGGHSAALTRLVGDELYLDASSSTAPAGDEALRNFYPMRLSDAPLLAQALRQKEPLVFADTESDPRIRERAKEIARVRGYRSILQLPLLRDGAPIGFINVSRQEPGPFTEDEMKLLRTFGDQAVIAIENVRLFNELQARTAELTRSVDELTALGDVGRALSSTLDLETVLQTIVTRANQLTGTAGCTIWEYDEPREEFRLRVSHYADAADAAVLQALGRVTVMRKGQGVTTRVVERREPVQIDDITVEGAYESPIRRPLVEAGHRALLGVPLLSEDEVIGVLAVTRKTPGEFEPETVRLLSTLATQSALAIQNARLFLEIEDKGRQLEVASQHKSEFLANMSHELRTPMNAILGFSEVLAEGMFGEINDKQAEYLRDILESGRHLLSLINDILDLSKIEAGRMELELEDFDVRGAVDNALTLVRERAGRRGIALGRVIDERVGTIRADERKVKQVLLNLLSNAIKFTPEGGRVDVRAAVNDTMLEVSVADTGVGIAPEDQEAVFEEFRQVGTASKKVEGTGLGLALSRKFIELHGGRIRVKSEVGVGSTFTFTLPLSR